MTLSANVSSMRYGCSPTTPWTSSSEPTHKMRPPTTAIASAEGLAGSSVTISRAV
ncbi:hypothetical protein ACW9UR_19145 [Halovulum sp. GXIMD14794]